MKKILHKNMKFSKFARYSKIRCAILDDLFDKMFKMNIAVTFYS